MLADRRHRRSTDNGQRTTDNGQRTSRRGVTLIEMLVTVAVLVIMMTILVQIFQAATGSVSAAQAYQQLDDQLRRLDGIIRGDLEGVTARFTPPLDPALNLGYFEYAENEFADLQGEDGDDYIRFTAKAPAGRPFTGRFWPTAWPVTSPVFGPNTTTGNNLSSFPITITSDYAEIIYFLRNGNLYRRVLLIAPELQSSIVPTVNNTAFGNAFTQFMPTILNGQPVSWQGMNDLSAHPAPTGPVTGATPLAQAQGTIVLNTLGHLTNRENRAFYARFANDFMHSTGATNGPDGVPDDINSDNIPDLYPSLYAGAFSTGASNPANLAGQLLFVPPVLPNHRTGVIAISSNPGVPFLAFPYVFPGAYSKAQAVANDAYGWIHAPSPLSNDSGTLERYDAASPRYLHSLNHNPLDLGDNLPTPLYPTITAGGNLASMEQTWWGFPTWRETLSPAWNDPTVQVNAGPFVPSQGPQTPMGLNYSSLNIPAGHFANPATDGNLLPPMAKPNNFSGDFSFIRRTQQLFCDGAGQASAFWGGAVTGPTTLWALSWEDDLVMTGVRSFDVKAYDNSLANYADLGWGDDNRISGFNGVPFLAGNPDFSQTWTNANNPVYPPLVMIQNQAVDYINQSMAHEGRIPPLQNDNRLDYQYPNPNYVTHAPSHAAGSVAFPLPSGFIPQYTGFPGYSSNVGDDNRGLVRLRRVWDTWSTDYSRAPATGVYVNNANAADPHNGFPAGPPFFPPIYPSYPPPYPAPLRGIQIQIRVADPTNLRIKSLTIRQDFTDKL